jgi:hypothetical protein
MIAQNVCCPEILGLHVVASSPSDFASEESKLFKLWLMLLNIFLNNFSLSTFLSNFLSNFFLSNSYLGPF